MRTRDAWTFVCVALAPTVAVAADQTATASEVVFFAALAVLILAGRLLGEGMQRFGQPAVMGQLLAGVLLGPSVFGMVAPGAQHYLFSGGPAQKAMLDAVSQLGILMLLLLTGMETDLRLVRSVGRAALSVSIAGIVLPFACGFALGHALPDTLLPHPEQRLAASLFIGTALSISSVKIVAMVVREMNFMRRDLGQLIVASAIIDDTIGWIIISLTFSFASHGSFDLLSVTQRLAGVAVFLGISFTAGRRAIFALIRWSNDHLVSEMPVISLIIVLMLLMALTTYALGLHTVLGAFVCGILVGESPILTRHIGEQLRGLILGLFMPVFFALAGLSADLSILARPHLLALTLGLIAIASIGKASGAFAGGKVAGLDLRSCVALACGMNARGSTEVVVASIGLSMGILSQDLFTMIVAMAMVTTLSMPPMLRRALAHVPIGADEQKRLDREAFETKGFIANLERVLLTVDDSASGRFASRLAGLLAGPRGISTTVLQLGRGEMRTAPHESAGEGPEATVLAAAASANTDEETPAKNVQVTTRRSQQEAKVAISAEAQRGYGLLVIGLDEPVGETGVFKTRVSRAAAGFEGAIGILIARGTHLKNPARGEINILAPVNRTTSALRAAEVAIALARGSHRAVCAVYTAEPDGGGKPILLRSRLREETILKDIANIADHYGVAVRTSIHTDTPPAQAISDSVRRSGSNLVVLGVTRQSGEALDFGALAGEVIASVDASVLLISD